MRSLKDGVAVVTGAGSGIGRALAVALGEAGCNLALADVDAHGLAETAGAVSGVRVTTALVDVARAEDHTRLRDAVERDFGRVSVLVNNAGVALYGSIDDASIEDLGWIMGINFWGTVYGTKTFLPLLRREPEASIVTLSSVFGLIGPPLQGGYAASKFAVRGFSEALRHELRGTGVRVTVVHPGGISTNIAKRTRRASGADAERFARDTREFERALVLPARVAARKIVRAIRAGKPRLLIGRDAHAIDALARLLPERHMAVVRALAR